MIKSSVLIRSKEQMIFTPPLVDHSMKLPIDTLFLTLSRNPRGQDSFGADVVSVNLTSTDGWGR